MQMTRLLITQLWRKVNTRTISPAADYLQVLHVMLSQEAMGAVEIKACWGEERYAWSSPKAGEQPRWSSVRSRLMLSHRNKAQIRAFHQRDQIPPCAWLSFVSRRLPGRMEPAGHGMDLTDLFSSLMQLTGSSREHLLSHRYVLFHLFNMLMLSRTFIYFAFAAHSPFHWFIGTDTE